MSRRCTESVEAALHVDDTPTDVIGDLGEHMAQTMTNRSPSGFCLDLRRRSPPSDCATPSRGTLLLIALGTRAPWFPVEHKRVCLWDRPSGVLSSDQFDASPGDAICSSAPA